MRVFKISTLVILSVAKNLSLLASSPVKELWLLRGQNNKACKTFQKGFTYIEMLTVIALMALCFVPILRMFTESVNEVRQYSDLGTAIQLGRDVMEEVKNFRLTEAQIESQGVVWIPGKKESPLILNGQHWKIKRSTIKHTDPLEVHVEVFREEDLNHPILKLESLIEDL